MNTLYLECNAGASGDMILGALQTFSNCILTIVLQNSCYYPHFIYEEPRSREVNCSMS